MWWEEEWLSVLLRGWVSAWETERETERQREREDVCIQMKDCRPNHRTLLRIFKPVNRSEMFCSLDFPMFYEQRSKTVSWTYEVGQELLREMEPSSIAGGNAIWWSHCGEQYGGSLKKYRTTSNPTIGHRSGKDKLWFEKKYTPHLFSAALFTRARTWKQPKHPLTGKRTKMRWYIHAMKYYWAVKRMK